MRFRIFALAVLAVCVAANASAAPTQDVKKQQTLEKIQIALQQEAMDCKLQADPELCFLGVIAKYEEMASRI